MGKKILLLDDDQSILDIVSFVLNDCGFDVQTQATGKSVFAVIAKFHPDLVLMDVMLAEMDGRLICRDLKSNILTLHIPVILISGTHNLSESLHQQGAPNDFLAKPFDLDVLLHKVNAQLV
jgi:two-component system phosphate regulon response regulator PhoB